MKRYRFQVYFEGTVTDLGKGHEEMVEAVKESFRPDLIHGVSIWDELYIVIREPSEEEEDGLQHKSRARRKAPRAPSKTRSG